jgi:ABC-type spermidine/putrescine transport system permease subunit II
MNSARDALVVSIHVGLAVAATAALVGLGLAWFVPPVRVGYAETDSLNT